MERHSAAIRFGKPAGGQPMGAACLLKKFKRTILPDRMRLACIAQFLGDLAGGHCLPGRR
jgi:hypothetical protein